jgi:hypothetical protein
MINMSETQIFEGQRTKLRHGLIRGDVARRDIPQHLF